MTTNASSATSDNATSPDYGFGCTLNLGVDDAVARVTDALKAEGFGVLTSIDVQATWKAKLGIDQEPYVILGACNPPLAHRAISADPNIGLLLPCNVVVRELPNTGDQPRSRVEAVDPVSMMGIVQNPELAAVASEARARLERVVASLT